MAQESPHRIGDLQLRILQILWDEGPSPISKVHSSLGGSEEYAYTTIATMLRKMEARSLVVHSESGRSFIYEPAVSADEIHRGMGEHFVDRLFSGRLADAVCHLLDSREVSAQELNQIEKLIKERKRKK